jgi:hypothetical protein
MKAIIDNGKIIEFVPDTYKAYNKEVDDGTHPTVSIKKIKGTNGLDIKLGSANDKRGLYPYYLNENGIVQMLDITAQPEYIEYQKVHMKADFQNEADPIFFQVQRGEKTQKEYDDKVAEIKARVY